MTEDNRLNNDERLLEQFFQEARLKELPDDGFTVRVMRRLPDDERQWQLSRLWTAVCIVAGVVLFTALGGWQALLAWVLKALATVPTTGMVAQLWITLFVLSALTIAEFFRREHIRLSL